MAQTIKHMSLDTTTATKHECQCWYHCYANKWIPAPLICKYTQLGSAKTISYATERHLVRTAFYLAHKQKCMKSESSFRLNTAVNEGIMQFHLASYKHAKCEYLLMGHLKLNWALLQRRWLVAAPEGTQPRAWQTSLRVASREAPRQNNFIVSQLRSLPSHSQVSCPGNWKWGKFLFPAGHVRIL